MKAGDGKRKTVDAADPTGVFPPKGKTGLGRVIFPFFGVFFLGFSLCRRRGNNFLCYNYCFRVERR